MKKHRLYMIRKQGDLFRCISIRLHRDTVTGEWSVSLSGFGHMLMICAAKPIPELCVALGVYAIVFQGSSLMLEKPQWVHIFEGKCVLVQCQRSSSKRKAASPFFA